MKKQFTLFNTRSERAVKEAAIARKKTKEAIEQCFALQRLHGSLDVSNNNKNAVKKEDLSGVYGHGHPQSQNGPLNNKIGTSGNNPVVVNNIGANVIDGRIGNNNGGRFGPPFKTSAF
jgi:Trm5-related predicted tRNA methylase